MATPAVYNLLVYQGDDFYDELEFTDENGPLDLTGAVVTAQIRKRAAAEEAVDITCNMIGPNIVTITLTAVQTQALARRGVWDLQVTYENDTTETLVYGEVTVRPGVTRPEVGP